MKLIVDIDEDYYKAIWENGYVYDEDNEDIAKIIKDGIPLPKGHGRLIDADTYRKEMLDSREFDFFKRLDMQPTVIEADKESEDKEGENK